MPSEVYSFFNEYVIFTNIVIEVISIQLFYKLCIFVCSEIVLIFRFTIYILILNLDLSMYGERVALSNFCTIILQNYYIVSQNMCTFIIHNLMYLGNCDKVFI